MFEKNSFSGKTFLITGGGSGLGLSIAKKLAALGAEIAICGRTIEKLKKAKVELESFGNKVSVHEVDVRDYEAVGEMISEILKSHGKLDGLINNAAGNFYCPSEDLTPNGFKTVVDIVLHGTFNCCSHFGNYLIDNKLPGSILNIVTTYTETGSAFVLPSAAAKAGVYAMTNTLAYEWAEYNIRVNSIAPGPFPTKGAWDRLMPEGFEEKYKQSLPWKRFGNPEELANLAAFLLSDASPYISGECVTIDGAARLNGGSFNFITQLMPRSKLKSMFQKMKDGRSS